MTIVKKKVSELPTVLDLDGLLAFGVDSTNKSVKIPLQFVKDAADHAEQAADEINALPIITAQEYSSDNYEI